MVIPVIFNFALLVIVLFMVGRKPLAQVFATRASSVGAQMTEAEALALESGKLLAEYEGKWKSSDAHAKALHAEMKAVLDKFRTSALAKAAAEAARIQKEASMVAMSESAKAAQLLQRELATKSVQAASTYLANHLTDDDRKKLVHEYMEILGNGSPG